MNTANTHIICVDASNIIPAVIVDAYWSEFSALVGNMFVM